jgi:hypothetical protein
MTIAVATTVKTVCVLHPFVRHQIKVQAIPAWASELSVRTVPRVVAKTVNLIQRFVDDVYVCHRRLPANRIGNVAPVDAVKQPSYVPEEHEKRLKVCTYFKACIASFNPEQFVITSSCQSLTVVQ